LEQARRFEATLPPVDWSASFRHAMLGERIFGLSAFEMTLSDTSQIAEDYDPVSSGEGMPIPIRLLASPLGMLWKPVLKLDEVEILRLWELHIQALTPMAVPMPASTTRRIDQALQDAPPYALLTKILFPVFSRAYQNRDSIEVGRRQRQVALALSAYRKTHGRYPAQLSQAEPLQGTMPHDLYRDQPLRYTSDGRSFSLYSVGPNGIDDGGRDSMGRDLDGKSARSGSSTNATDDIVWNPKRR
jgi:type II secretory pathway pseudopilin PulG